MLIFLIRPHLSPYVCISLHWHVACTLNQTLGDEDVVHRDDEERNDVKNEERAHGVDFGVQLSSMRVWSTCTECLVGFGYVKGVEVGEHGLGNGQDHGEQPNGGGSQADL